MKSIYIFPGKFAASTEPAKITTILGSCVSVVLYDPILKIGGLNHYLLPECTTGEKPSERYGDIAIPRLVAELEAMGSTRNKLQAKIFGGAAVLNDVTIGLDIGRKNIQQAEQMLSTLRIPVVHKDTGGRIGRHIVFRTDTFEVVVRFPALEEAS